MSVDTQIFFMALTKDQKQKNIKELKEKIDKQKAIAFANIAGLKVQDLTKLRREMKKQECEIKVAKKTLTALALKEKGVLVDFKKIQGELALAFGYKDEVSAFRILNDFLKEHEHLKILGGLIGDDFLDQEKAIALAQLPTRDQLLAKLVGSISSPLSGLVFVLQGNIKGLINVLAKAKS